MSNLIRRLRVDVTRQNLRQIAQLDKTIDASRDVFTNLEKCVTELDGVRRKMGAAVANMPNKNSEETQALLATLKPALESLSDLLSNLQRSHESAEAMLGKHLMAVMKRPDVRTLITQADAAFYALSEENYFGEEQRCVRLFGEYIDVLRGSALRDGGVRYQNGISELFRIAEALPLLWGNVQGWKWQSVAVPSRSEGHGLGTANVLRMGFPEWSVWALPLVQHEVGLVALEQAAKAGMLRFDRSAETEAFALADAAATLATGPAYAYAVLSLRLNPAGVHNEQDVDARRAATIIAALRVAADVDPTSSLGAIVDELFDAWVGAVGESGGDAQLARTLPGDEGVQAAVGAAQDLLETATKDIGGGEPTALAWCTQWSTVEDWSGKLDTDEATLDVSSHPTPLGRPIAVAMLLNAAWRWRVEMGFQEPDEFLARYDALERIAKTVVARCVEVVEAAASGGGGGTPSQAIRQ